MDVTDEMGRDSLSFCVAVSLIRNFVLSGCHVCFIFGRSPFRMSDLRQPIVRILVFFLVFPQKGCDTSFICAIISIIHKFSNHYLHVALQLNAV